MVRNAVTGNTHLLEALASAVLRTLIARNEPMSAAQVAEHLDSEEGLDEVLAELHRLGLVQRVA